MRGERVSRENWSGLQSGGARLRGGLNRLRRSLGIRLLRRTEPVPDAQCDRTSSLESVRCEEGASRGRREAWQCWKTADGDEDRGNCAHRLWVLGVEEFECAGSVEKPDGHACRCSVHYKDVRSKMCRRDYEHTFFNGLLWRGRHSVRVHGSGSGRYRRRLTAEGPEA